jgi:hypothetical protein
MLSVLMLNIVKPSFITIKSIMLSIQMIVSNVIMPCRV